MSSMTRTESLSSPPPYTPRTTPSFSSSTTNPSTPKPKSVPSKQVEILLLGSPSTGKSTFLSRLPQVAQGPITSKTPFPTRNSLDNPRPFVFDVTLFRRPYTFNIYTSTTTLFTDPFPAHPNFVIITYDVTSRASLHNARYYWRRQFTSHYMELEQSTPVMLLGLKRDLRTDELDEETGETRCVMPDEGLKAAIEMRCDKYAECSAVTGELLWEAVEDITRVAAKTTTENGGLSEGSSCCLM